MKINIKSALTLLVTVVLIYLVIRKVGVENLLETLAGTDLRFVAVSVILTPVLLLVSVFKWQILLRAQGITVSVWRLFLLYLVGRFFSQFLPSNVGGDVVRTYELKNDTDDLAGAAASVFMERFTGFVTLVLMTLFVFVTNIALLKNLVLAGTLLSALLAMTVIVWLIVDDRPLQFLLQYLKGQVFQKYLTKLKKLHRSVQCYKHQKKAITWAMLWSVVFYAGAAIGLYVNTRAFHSPVPFWGLVVILPILMLVAMMPITFNGIGLQEWAYVLLFTWLGLPASVGLSVILLSRAKNTLTAVAGGIIYPAIKSKNPQTQQNQVVLSGDLKIDV
ncbi:MAG: UPF0104 family protein [Chloroflexi bacterium]|nr:MAG: UPF0104 family protein [Chloroflexota bacterium]